MKAMQRSILLETKSHHALVREPGFDRSIPTDLDFILCKYGIDVRMRDVANDLRKVRLPRIGDAVAVVYLNDKNHKLL